MSSEELAIAADYRAWIGDLKYVRQWVEFWNLGAIGQQDVAQLDPAPPQVGQQAVGQMAKQPVAQSTTVPPPGFLTVPWGHNLAILAKCKDQDQATFDGPTIALLMCKSKRGLAAEYALRDINKPTEFSTYTLSQMLPDSLRDKLTSIEASQQELWLDVDQLDDAQ